MDQETEDYVHKITIMDQETKDYIYGITISEAIEVLSYEEDRKLSLKTEEEYSKIFQRLEANNFENFYEGSQRYFYKKKAAASYCITKMLESYTPILDKNELEDKMIEQIINKADSYIHIYHSYCKNTGVSPVKRKPPTKNSKRLSISRMNDYWREQIWAECENPNYRGAVAVMDLAGIRPCELEKGVLVERQEDSSYLTITIKGGKIGEEGKNGQKVRTIKVDLSTDCYRGSPKDYLLNHCFENGFFKIKTHPKRLNDYVRRISEKLWPRKINHIAPYSYRQQTSPDIKKDGFSKKKTAKTLGHRSTRSQKNYGTARQGGRRNSIIGVECSDPVRTYESKYNSIPTNTQGGKQDLVKGQ